MNEKETRALLTQLSAIDNRVVTDLAVAVWNRVLARFDWDTEVLPALDGAIESARFDIRPADIVDQIKIGRARRRELHGLHPTPPPGRRWAVDAIENDPEYAPESRKEIGS
ncbi:hypothetical protein [Herbiconiux sp.]|uniref:hypothetical protein n=1 Tax=Herbiconiux sp. TaxID=1871186 RepID=UPI0025B809FE|nr:hypothetical protein [Herbiconiux sp.]